MTLTLTLTLSLTWSLTLTLALTVRRSERECLRLIRGRRYGRYQRRRAEIGAIRRVAVMMVDTSDTGRASDMCTTPAQHLNASSNTLNLVLERLAIRLELGQVQIQNIDERITGGARIVVIRTVETIVAAMCISGTSAHTAARQESFLRCVILIEDSQSLRYEDECPRRVDDPYEEKENEQDQCLTQGIDEDDDGRHDDAGEDDIVDCPRDLTRLIEGRRYFTRTEAHQRTK